MHKTKKQAFRVIYTSDNVYNDSLTVCIGSMEDTIKFVRKHRPCSEHNLEKDRDAKGIYTLLHHKDKVGKSTEIPLIWLKEFNGTPENYATLVHEVMHYVFCRLGSFGMKLCEESEEAYTYLVDSTITKILKGIKDQNTRHFIK